MGYSLQSIFVNTTNQYEYRESTSPIIELIEGCGIKTLDKYGKVTVILEENQSYGA
jgi:nitrate reductase NapAB chaperone NapD